MHQRHPLEPTRLRALGLSILASVPAALALQTPDLVWESEVLQPADTFVGDVLPLADGGAFTTLGQGSTGPLRLARIAGSGAVVSLQAIGSATRRGEFQLATDGAGGAFLAGAVTSAGLADPPLGLDDVVLLRVGSSGSVQWSRRLGTTAYDQFGGLVADGSGGVFVVGSTGGGGFAGPNIGAVDGFVARYDPSGAELWAHRIGFAGEGTYLRTAASDLGGNVLCGGSRVSSVFGAPIYSIVVRVDRAGSIVGSQPVTSLAGRDILDIVPDGTGGSVSLFLDYTGTAAYQRLDAAGNLLWWTELDPTASYLDVASHSLERLPGGLFVLLGSVRRSPLPSSRYMRAVDLAGTTQWEWLHADPAGADSYARSAVDDGAGSLYGIGSVLRSMTPPFGAVVVPWVARIAVEPLGVAGCVGQPNSTGAAARANAVGSPRRADDRVTVYAGDLPPHQFGYFLASTSPGFVAGPGGSQGFLCLGGAIGRFNRPGEVLGAGATGRFHLVLDLDDVPTPGGTTSVVAGQTWYFQAWYRDTHPTPTSNFTSSLSLVTL